jgi:hypothetical protein
VEAHILLADAAQRDQAGKVHALGLGWSTTTTPLPPQAIVVLIKVPWDQANRVHRLVVELLDADGRPVSTTGPVGDQPIRIEGDFEAGRPPGIPQGSPLDLSATFAIAGGLPLAEGRYTWNLSIDGHHEEAWSASFLVRQRQQPSQATS